MRPDTHTAAPSIEGGGCASVRGDNLLVSSGRISDDDVIVLVVFVITFLQSIKHKYNCISHNPYTCSYIHVHTCIQIITDVCKGKGADVIEIMKLRPDNSSKSEVLFFSILNN